MIYSTEKSLRDLGDKLPGDERERVQSAISELKAVLESDDLDNINAKINTLKDTMYAASSKMYKDDSAGGGSQGSSSASEDDNIVDADYEEVK